MKWQYNRLRMKRSLSWYAAMLLVLLVPVQAMAAACAQICAKAQFAQHAATQMGGAGHHCDQTDGTGDAPVPDGKCCHAHTFMTEPPSTAAVAEPPAFEPLRFVARWRSFIPEEPSPPPIARTH